MPDTSITLDDGRRYRRAFLLGTSMMLVVFALGSATQSSLLQLAGEPMRGDPSVGGRLLANFAGLSAVILGCALVPLERMTWPARLGTLLALGIVGGITRMLVQLSIGIHAWHRLDLALFDSLAAAGTTAFSLIAGLVLAEYQQRLTQQERLGALQATRAAEALEALQAEELRVRREVADGLHGTVQQQLVLVDVRLGQLAEGLTGHNIPEDYLDELTRVREQLTELREADVRSMSRLLYPSGIDLGIAQASRLLMDRLPATIAVTTVIDESLLVAEGQGAPEISIARRVLAIRALEEAVTNALRHGRASALHLDIRVDGGGVLQTALDDNGSGLSAGSVGESGLLRLRERFEALGGTLTLGPGPHGGARMRARLPLGDHADEAHPRGRAT